MRHDERYLSPYRSPRAPALLLLGILLGLAACGPDGRGAPRTEGPSRHLTTGTIEHGAWSVVLITLDTTRPDHLAPYGAPNADTPALGSLAEQGVVFDRAFAVAPVTLPSHASLLTGLEPPRHGVRDNGIFHLEPGITTLAERLSAAGWRTAAFVSAAVLERRYGLDQGFEIYDDDLSGGGPRAARSMLERPASATVDAALSWLDGLKDGKPFFLWVHLFDPHVPYAPPAPFAERFRQSPYDGEIAYMDSQIARLLAHPLLARDRVVTVAVGDHGESLGEHGEKTHGMLVYDATLHIPFLLRLPAGPRGLRIETPVSQVDLVPTLADLLDLPSGNADDESYDGRSLLPDLMGKPGPERALYAESQVAFDAYGWAKLKVLRRGWDKYIEAPTPELYDLKRDPAEAQNLAQRQPGLAAELATELDGRKAGDREKETALARDPEAEARLRSLGYLPAAGGRSGDSNRPDPKDVIGVHEDLQRVGVLLQQRSFAQAAHELRAVLARDPGNPTALENLARAWSELGRGDDARAALERALSLDPANVNLHLALADLEARRRNPQRALELTDAALELDPGSLEAKIDKARYLQSLGRQREAERLMTEVARESDNSPWVELRHVEVVELPAGDLKNAELRLRRVVDRDPNLIDAWLRLGEVLDKAGRPAEAVEVYRRALDHQPRDLELLRRLGRLLAQAGDSGAEEVLRRAVELSRDQAIDPPADVVQNLASLALADRRWEEAETWARQAVELHPGLAAAWNNLGIACEEQGRPSEAVEAYRRAIEADSTYWQASFNRGLLEEKQRRFREAAAAFEEVLRQVPDHADAHYHLGLLDAGPLGDAVAARRHLRAALEAEPDHPRSSRVRELLSRLGDG